MRVPLLDHGYLNLVESWGTDARIIESARMSTDKGFLGWGPRCEKCQHWFPEKDGEVCLTQGCEGKTRISGDEKLLRYLYENKHATPFEFAGMIVEVQAPIFVFREWMRHRTQSYNEMSARYVKMPNLHYVPSVDRVCQQSKSNKQGSGETMRTAEALVFLGEIQEHQQAIYAAYERAIEAGISKEIARINTPVSRYSRMRASANLRNWLGFLTLRQAPNAQYEIKVYADAIAAIIAQLFPRTYELFAENKQ